MLTTTYAYYKIEDEDEEEDYKIKDEDNDEDNDNDEDADYKIDALFCKLFLSSAREWRPVFLSPFASTICQQ